MTDTLDLLNMGTAKKSAKKAKAKKASAKKTAAKKPDFKPDDSLAVLNASLNEGATRLRFSAAMSSMLDAATAWFADQRYKQGRGNGKGDVAFKRIGAGYIGMECERCLAFKFHRYQVEEREKEYVTKGELNRHAESGHWTEDKMADWLREAGLELTTEVPGQTGYDGKPKQHGHMSVKNDAGQCQIAGEVDGIIHKLPSAVPEGYEVFLKTVSEELSVPAIWESKKATSKKFKKFLSEGVKKADPRYYGQLQCNMHFMGANHTLFSMLNLDDMKTYFEVVEFDPAYTDKMLDKATRVLRSESPEDLMRLCNNPDDFRGMFCDYKKQCWEMGA